MTEAALNLPELPTKLECPPGDCFDFPTKGDLVNMINKIGEVPSKLRVYAVQMGDELDAESKAEIDAIIEDVEGYMEKFESILSPYWQKGTIRNWNKEAKDAITQLIAEFHLYIPAKMLDIIGKIIPLDLSLNVLGISINIPKITTKEEQERIIAQISGMGTDVKVKIEALKELDDITAEDLKIKTDVLISAEVDKFFKMIPSVYQQFGGEYGLTVNELKAKATWSYIKSEIQDWIQNIHFKAYKTLIGKFDIIWDALGLPNITALFTLDVPKIIEAAIDTVKLKYEVELGAAGVDIEALKDLSAEDLKLQTDKDISVNIEDLSIKKAHEMREEIKDKILDLQIGPLPLKTIIGASVEESVTSIEDQIDEFIVAARDFSINWQKKLLFDWVKIVKAFFDAIGLGAIFDLISLTFCNILELIGFPFDVNIKFPSGDKLKGMGIALVAGSLTPALAGATGGPASIVKVVNNITTTAGQTVIAGSYADGNVVVVNKNNLETLFTDYSVVDGDIVLDTAAAAGDKYIAIPTDG